MQIKYKYIALGILVGYLLPYIIQLTQKVDKGKSKLSDYDSTSKEY